MKKLLVILMLFPVTIFNGCYDNSETSYVTRPAIVEPPIITEPPQEGLKMLKAIKESPNYFIKDTKQLFSIDSHGVNTIPILNEDDNAIELVDFFRKSSESFFTIKTYSEIDNPDYDPLEEPQSQPEKIYEEIITFYKQVDEEVSKIDLLPNKPPVSRTQYTSQTFTIENDDYEGTMVSDVRNETMGSEARFFLVNGAAAYVPEVGLFFHVQDGLYDDTHMVRENGLYFFPENRKSVQKINTTGVLW